MLGAPGVGKQFLFFKHTLASIFFAHLLIQNGWNGAFLISGIIADRGDLTLLCQEITVIEPNELKAGRQV